MPKKIEASGKTARLDKNAHKIIEDVKKSLTDEGFARPDTSDAIRKLAAGNRLANDLCALLWFHVGETGANEGAVDVMRRILDEWKSLKAKKVIG